MREETETMAAVVGVPATPAHTTATQQAVTDSKTTTIITGNTKAQETDCFAATTGDEADATAQLMSAATPVASCHTPAVMPSTVAGAVDGLTLGGATSSLASGLTLGADVAGSTSVGGPTEDVCAL